MCQFIYRCIDYLRALDVKIAEDVASQDPDTRVVLEGLGGKDELVRTGRISYVAACRVEDFAFIAHMEPNTVSFPPVFPRQPYTREDVHLEREEDDNVGRWVAAEVRSSLNTGDARLTKLKAHVHILRAALSEGRVLRAS